MRLKLSRLLLTLLFVLPALASGADEPPVTQDSLESLPPLPEAVMELPYDERVEWFQQKLRDDVSKVEQYRLHRELAFEHYYNNSDDNAIKHCQTFAPQQFDLAYRYTCVSANGASYEKRVAQLTVLYEEALQRDAIQFATQILSEIGWFQASNGRIRLAFKSYEEALELAQNPLVSWAVLSGVMQNSATLYVMYGDDEYVQNGIALHKRLLNRAKELRDDGQLTEQDAKYAIAVAQFNLGIAYTFHLHDYKAALKWFDAYTPNTSDESHSKHVFSALAAIELGKSAEAKDHLQQAQQHNVLNPIVRRYLQCYQQLVRVKLSQDVSLQACNTLKPETQLEVKVDVYKRMSALAQADLKTNGLEHFYELYQKKLEPLLKQSNSEVASNAELSRLKLESRLQDELLNKEQQLKKEEEKRRSAQSQLTYALVALFLLVVLFGLFLFRLKGKQTQRFKQLSRTDGLTGLYNRSYFESEINRYYPPSGGPTLPEETRFAIHLFDIDNFKHINDTYGHEMGDRVLIEFSRRISALCREDDLFARWGGEEFLLATRIDSLKNYHDIAQRLCHAVAQEPFQLSPTLNISVSCTVGSIVYPYHVGDKHIHWSQLIRLADLAMYYGKEQGRNCWVCIDDIKQPAELERILTQSLDKSITEDRVTVSHSLS